MMVYKKYKQAGLSVPNILGLTASPVISTSMDDLERLESTLDAVCRTPIKHRGELLSHAKRPTTVHITYEPARIPGRSTEAMASLKQVWQDVTDRIREDPYVKKKAFEGTERSIEDLRQVLLKQETPTIKQMRSLYRKTEHILNELGPWGADLFLRSAITEYLKSVDKKDVNYAGWNVVEKEYLADALRMVKLPDLKMDGDIPISDKVSKLILQLLTSNKSTQGIIFIQETAAVYALQSILTTHRFTRDHFRFGAMVGTSRHGSKKRDVGELVGDNDHLDLDKFRLGKLSFLIATSVLEEGIDVPACNLVISFSPPTNLRAFIQRRGRARMRESQLVLFWDTGNATRKSWEKYEAEMKSKYEVEDREKKELDALEESEQSQVPPFRTKLGAELDFDAAVSHLQHFCNVMVSGQYIDKSPYFLIKRTRAMASKSEPSQIKATVVLPNFLPPHLHRINSEGVWYSEKNARKDAAFQAYRKLYEAGLINENLLPLQDNDLAQVVDIRAPTVEVDETWNPWPRIARAWSNSHRYHYGIKVIGRDGVLHDTDMILPVPIPPIPQFDIYWDWNPWKMEITLKRTTEVHDNEESGPDQTMALVKLAHGHRELEFREDAQLVVQFSAQDKSITTKSFGAEPFHEHFATSSNEFPYLVRDGLTNRLYIYEEYLPSMPSLISVTKRHSPSTVRFIDKRGRDGPWLALRPWPHPRNVLHKPSPQKQKPQKKSRKRYHTVWPVSCCSVDIARIADVRFGFMISSIMHVMEAYLIAEELSRATVLKDLGFRDLSLIITATSASSTNETTDYQRLEFFGDVLLKLISTISVAVERKSLPKYLLVSRASIVN
jgi:ERCC4-related helicase